MKFYRLVKPIWSHPKKANGEQNPKFQSDITGPNILEGVDFSVSYLRSKNDLGYSIYFFPNHPIENPYSEDIRFLNGRLINQFNFVFADIDFKDGVYGSVEEVLDKITSQPLKPSMVVSSGHGVHIYYKVVDLTRESYIAIQLQLIKYFNSDPSVFTVLQLMRLPGYLNTKDFQSRIPCIVVRNYSSNQSYSVSDLRAVLPPLSDEEKQRGRLHLDRLEGKISLHINRDVDLDELPDKFIALCDKKPHIKNLFDDPTADGGDRSAVDMKLAHILYSKEFNVNEVMAVMSNTQKALEKGGNRIAYAELTCSKVFENRKTQNFQTVADFLKTADEDIREPLVGGPSWLDTGVLGNPWRRKEILGIISGSGIGKTAFSLNVIRQTIENNSESDDIYVFVSLEMTKRQIIQRWIDQVGAESEMANRLFVIDSFDSEGKDRLMGLQEIYKTCMEIKQFTGKNIGMIVVDYFHIISTHISLKEKPLFGIQAEGGSGYGDIRNLTPNQVASQLRALAAMLDTFLIILAQTTKEKGRGDTPLFKDSCFYASNFDWVSHRIITIWQPLLRVQDQTNLRVLAFQYAKIRELHEEDKIKVYDPKLLTYDMKTGVLRGTNTKEYQEFIQRLPQANEKRKKDLKNEGATYSVLR